MFREFTPPTFPVGRENLASIERKGIAAKRFGNVLVQPTECWNILHTIKI
jgi:hypothetical protein